MNPKSLKTVAGLLAVLLLMTPISGCWERRELNETAFVLGLGLDKAPSGYRVTLQVVIPSAITPQAAGGGGGVGVPVIMSSFNVPTLYETQRQYALISSRVAYYGHIRVLVIGEELARSGIAEVLDVLKRSREPRDDYYVMVARNNTAENVLGILTPLNKLPASKLFESLEKSQNISAKTVAVPFRSLLESMLCQGKNPVLTGLEILGNSKAGKKQSSLEGTLPQARMRFSNVAVFRKDKMLGWLDDNETIGYNYVTDNVVQSTGPVEGDDGQPIVIGSLQTSTTRKVKVENGKPHIYLHVKATCNVQEVESLDDLSKEETIKELERKTEERIIYRMRTAVEHINERFNADIMGFGESIYRSNPKAWARLKEEYGDDYLKSLPIHYKATVRINRIGLIDRSIIGDIKE
jgi:spore germination protein KC